MYRFRFNKDTIERDFWKCDVWGYEEIKSFLQGEYKFQQLLGQDYCV